MPAHDRIHGANDAMKQAPKKDIGCVPESARDTKRRTVAASSVGLSLTIGKKALAQFDRLHREATRDTASLRERCWD